MNSITYAQIMEHSPCYDPAKYIQPDWTGTALDILAMENVPARDRLWVATRKGFLSDKTLRLFAVACARSGEHLLTDERSRNAITVAERFANGEATEQELAAARDAAWDAAGAAAWDAARDAARDATLAAGDAARDAARDEQIKMLRKIIGENER